MSDALASHPGFQKPRKTAPQRGARLKLACREFAPTGDFYFVSKMICTVATVFKSGVSTVLNLVAELSESSQVMLNLRIPTSLLGLANMFFKGLAGS